MHGRVVWVWGLVEVGNKLAEGLAVWVGGWRLWRGIGGPVVGSRRKGEGLANVWGSWQMGGGAGGWMGEFGR